MNHIQLKYQLNWFCNKSVTVNITHGLVKLKFERREYLRSGLDHLLGIISNTF